MLMIQIALMANYTGLVNISVQQRVATEKQKGHQHSVAWKPHEEAPRSTKE